MELLILLDHRSNQKVCSHMYRFASLGKPTLSFSEIATNPKKGFCRCLTILCDSQTQQKHIIFNIIPVSYCLFVSTV